MATSSSLGVRSSGDQLLHDLIGQQEHQLLPAIGDKICIWITDNIRQDQAVLMLPRVRCFEDFEATALQKAKSDGTGTVDTSSYQLQTSLN